MLWAPPKICWHISIILGNYMISAYSDKTKLEVMGRYIGTYI